MSGMSDMTDAESISSPSATGGGGPYFEQHVGAYWLALLLVEGCPPILIDTIIRKVSFQAEHLGWHTDDALITCEPENGGECRIACQVKKAFSVGADDEDFRGTILDAWHDFNGSVFGADDAFAIVTQRGTNVILRDLATLFDTARTSSGAADFAHRLTTPGLVSRQVRRHYGVIETIIDNHEGSPADRDRIWRFLRRIYVLPFDLNTDTAQTEAQMRTILARTVSTGEPLSGARSTWNELLREVSSGAPKAQEYERKDLPASALGRHSITAPDDRRALHRLAQHANVILAGIDTKIGGVVHLPRATVVTDVLAHLEQSRLLLLTGSAGSGKSAIAKDIAAALAKDHFVFAFRAEEFAQPHLDAALNAVGLGVTADDFAALIGAQPRKVLIVESVERILEAATRDAFADLLRFVRNDPTWRLIITCRDYSVELLRVAFLDARAIAHATVGVPPLFDNELAVIAHEIPMVGRLLANSRMKALLRNAYVLEMAVRIPWSEHESLPETERDFRRRFWSHFVRADRRDRGMPQRRATTFTEICVRRAKALTLFAPVAGLDAEAVDALEHDSLVVFSADNRNAVAPAHDVLEDWGVLEWIDETYLRLGGDLVQFAEALGGAPAIRRTYRTWVAEFLDRDAENADALFAAAIAAAGVPHHFRDDTIIAFLRSPRAPELLQRHTASLFADDKRLFRRIVHLLRVGCVRLPPWAPAAMAASLLFQPEGAAWAAVLHLVQEHLQDFDGRDRQLLLGLVEDWAKGVSAETPRPDGHKAAAAITMWLIPYCSDYNSKQLLQRAISVLAKIPASDPEGFERVLRGGEDELRDAAAERLQEIVFDEIEGYAASRDLPAIVIAAGKEYFLAREEEIDDRYHSPIDIDSFFGMRRSHGSHLPPSAYRGPFRALLREHPKDGRDFIVDLLNYTGTWYGERRGHGHDLEEAWEIELTFADGTTKKQWANPRLWNLYRGTTVTPYPLQSAAMALEAWFFDVAEQQKNLLDPLLLQTLRMSDSASVTAIVASIAVRYPYACGETLLVLLSSRDCIRMDRVRMAQDSTGSVYSRLPQYKTLNEIFAKERADSDALEHRRRDLEMAIAQLQASPFAERVHAALDAHIAALPPIAEQTEDDQVWRIALHRMDLRKYRVASENEVPTGSAPDAAAGENYIVLTPEDPEPDLKAMMQRTAEEYSRVSSRLSDQMWGVKIFERAADNHYDAGEWRARLTAVRSAPAPGDLSEQLLFGDAPTIIAAVCVRDHWDELTADERSWCRDRIVAAVRDTGSDWSDLPRMPGVMGGTMPAAAVVPLLVGRTDAAADALDALAAALTHPQTEVRVAAARAAGDVLWPRHRDVCLRAMDALRVEADALDDAFGFRRTRRYLDPAEATRVRSESAEAARRIIRADSAAPDAETTTVASDGWFAAEAALERASIALGAPDEPSSIAVFTEIASALVAWWHTDRHDRRDQRERRSYETEYALEKIVAEALFRVTEANAATVAAPLLVAVDAHPGKVNSIVENLTFREDRDPATGRYWALWRLFAERAAFASWLPDVDSQYSDGKQYLTTVFLASNWKETTRDWKSLTGHAEEVHTLFERLPLSRTSLHRYLLFLYHIGEQSLPHAFVRLYEKVKGADVPDLLTERDSAFVLESLLLRYVYAKPLELKRQHNLRTAVLFLLDTLVETGSSSAFRMRDDFVTPISELPPVAASSERGASALSAG